MLGSVGPPTSIGLRILVVRAVGNEATTTTLNVVTNWFEVKNTPRILDPM